MDEDAKAQALVHIRMILASIQRLQGILPDEEAHVGSDLFALDRGIMKLADKYDIDLTAGLPSYGTDANDGYDT